jgi:outer membrane protein, heavy metal efflux system
MNKLTKSHQFGAMAQGKWLQLSLLLMGLLLLCVQHTSLAAETYHLQQLIQLAQERNPSVNVALAQQDAALAAVTTSQAYANPEIEAGAGPTRSRTGTNEIRNNWGITLSQPLEFSDVRQARRAVADSNVAIAGIGQEITKLDLRTRVKDAFFAVLQRQAVLKLVEGDRLLLQQIRDRVQLKVQTGEAPRYELIKADTELLAAERDYQSAVVRITEAKSYLRGLLANALPVDFELAGELPLKDSLPEITALKSLIAESPQIRQLKAANQTAEAKLRLEERLRTPGLTLKAGVDQDPDLTSVRLGVAIPLPLWNKREGQIAEASANIRQVQAVLSEREVALNRDIESAYQRYLIAQQQVLAFENGLLSQSEAVLKTAEAAYRYGERGILEYLDAQRTYRLVRKDYLAARYDYVSAMLEIERLLGSELLPATNE